MELLVFLGSLFFFLLLNIPIALVMVLAAIVLMLYSGDNDFMIIPQAMVDGVNNYPLMAIPFFVFAGEIMAKGGLSKRVILLAQLMIGRVKGGLGYATIIASIIFAGLMGSSVGEAAALMGILYPMMKDAGYDRGRAGGVIASGAILGPIIPPSANFILLGATMELSITKLFMIGLVPGLLIGLFLLVMWFFIVRKDGYSETITFTRAEAISILKEATPAFMLPVLLLGGIRGGIFTPTEGGAFAAVYAIVVTMLYYRELPPARPAARQRHGSTQYRRGHAHRRRGHGCRLVHHRSADSGADDGFLPATGANANPAVARDHGLSVRRWHGYGSDAKHPAVRAGVLSAYHRRRYRPVLFRPAFRAERRHRRHHAAGRHGTVRRLRFGRHFDGLSCPQDGAVPSDGSRCAIDLAALPENFADSAQVADVT